MCSGKTVDAAQIAMQFLLALQIRRFVMRKPLVGIVALICAVGGVAACGNSQKNKEKTPVAETQGVPVGNVEKVEKVQKVENVQKSDPTATGVSESVGLEAASKARFTLVLNEGKSGFKFRSVTLSDAAKAKIDEMFTGDNFDMKNAHFEIEGHTDNLGSMELNHQVGLARAEAVKQYLGEQHEIPADCITVVSYGMEKPVADNSTPEGRARNRRVVIKVVD
jgi:outer membrane protein OmpA-like peptidoglycan-associated protein